MDAPPTPPLTGRRVHLRSVHPGDYEYLYALATNEVTNARYQYRGTYPSPDTFAQNLWQNSLVQFVVEHKGSKQPIGHLSAYDASDRHGWCRIAVILDPALSHQGWALESLALFFNYLFGTFNFRKLYGEVIEHAYPDLASGAGRWFRVEGRLVDHEWYAGRYWDLVILALHRADWDAHGVPLIERLTAPRPATVAGA